MKEVITVIVLLILLAIALIDHYTMTIPNSLIAILLIPILIWVTFLTKNMLLEHILGILCISLPMFVLTILKRGCFGGGDIKLMMVTGLLLGWKNTILAAIIALFFGGIYCIYLVIVKKGNRESRLAFGPFLAVGVSISLLWGEKIVLYYLNI